MRKPSPQAAELEIAFRRHLSAKETRDITTRPMQGQVRLRSFISPLTGKKKAGQPQCDRYLEQRVCFASGGRSLSSENSRYSNAVPSPGPARRLPFRGHYSTRWQHRFFGRWIHRSFDATSSGSEAFGPALAAIISPVFEIQVAIY